MMISSGLDILSASPQALATHLLQSRFQNDTHATLQYLLQTMEQLPNVEELTHQLLDPPQPQNTIVTISDEIAAPNASADGSITTTMLGDVLVPEFEVSSVIPRGKYNCTVHTNGLCLQSKTVASDCIHISSSAVRYAIVFPTPEDCVKAVLIASPKPTATRRPSSKKRKSNIDDNDEDGEDTAEMIISSPNNTPISTTRQGRMILLCFSSPVVVSAATGDANKKPKTYTHVCFPLSSFSSSEDGYKQEESCLSSLESALKVSLFRISLPISIMKSGNRGNHFQFISDKEQSTSTTTSGMPFVKCHKGVQDGALYPMEEGLLFYKPPMFVHRSQFHSISCGRGSSSTTSSRYVDLVVQLEDEEEEKHLNGSSTGQAQKALKKKKIHPTIEFNNIHREELNVLNQYIHETLIPAMLRDTEEATADCDEKEEEEETRLDIAATSGKKTKEIDTAAMNEDDDDDEEEEEDFVSDDEDETEEDYDTEDEDTDENDDDTEDD